MRALATFLAISAAALAAHAAEVVRCTDASGAISYTNVACPPGSKQSRQVPILESPPPDPARRDYTPPQTSSAPPVVPPSQVASNPPSGPAIIPRYPAESLKLVDKSAPSSAIARRKLKASRTRVSLSGTATDTAPTHTADNTKREALMGYPIIAAFSELFSIEKCQELFQFGWQGCRKMKVFASLRLQKPNFRSM